MDILSGPDTSRSGTDLLDLSQNAVYLNKVADTDGPFRHDNEPADEIVNYVLGAETDAYCNSTAKKSKGCNWDIEHPKSKEQYQKIGEIGEHFLNGRGCGLLESSSDEQAFSYGSIKDTDGYNPRNENTQRDHKFSNSNGMTVDHQNLEIPNRREIL
jgi:hypothetical protein